LNGTDKLLSIDFEGSQDCGFNRMLEMSPLSAEFVVFCKLSKRYREYKEIKRIEKVTIILRGNVKESYPFRSDVLVVPSVLDASNGKIHGNSQ